MPPVARRRPGHAQQGLMCGNDRVLEDAYGDRAERGARGAPRVGDRLGRAERSRRRSSGACLARPGTRSGPPSGPASPNRDCSGCTSRRSTAAPATACWRPPWRSRRSAERVAPGPYVPTVLASAVILASDGKAHAELLPGLADGTLTGAVALDGDITGTRGERRLPDDQRRGRARPRRGARRRARPAGGHRRRRGVGRRRRRRSVTVTAVKSLDLTRGVAKVELAGGGRARRAGAGRAGRPRRASTWPRSCSARRRRASRPGA